MCTLTYLPTKKGFLFSSSRDEVNSRQPAVFPRFENIAESQLLMPSDPQGGGTWIIVTNEGQAACLLNGAHKNHKRKPPYRKSRGMVLLESFDYQKIDDFIKEYDFSGIEPFTLVRIQNDQLDGQGIFEIRWDGKEIEQIQTDASKPQLWSSVTLYSEPMRKKRIAWFEEWLTKKPSISIANVRNFHLHGGQGDASVNFKMSRGGGLQTISLTCIRVNTELAEMDYQDLLTDQREKVTLLKKEV